MKKWIPIFAVVVVGFVVIVFSTSSAKGAGHHELVERLDSKTSKVEIFWEAPARSEKKFSAILYVHGMQDEGRPGAINLVRNGILRSTAKLGHFAAGMSMPGYGQSSGEGDFCGPETQMALRSAVAYLRGRADVDPARIAVSGLSCGAVTASMIADKEPLAAMILISGVYDLEDMYAKWRTPAWPLQRDVVTYIDKNIENDGGLRTAAKHRSALPNAGQFKMPLLLVAGGKDRIVDSSQSKALAEAMRSNGHANRLIFNPEGGHTVPPEDWVKYSTEFLQESLNKK